MTLGEKLRQLREEKDWSSVRLARESGISRAYLWQIESGNKQSPSLQVLQKLCGALSVTLSDLCDVERPGIVLEGLSPGLAMFVEKRAVELGVHKADVETLKNIRFRGRQPDKPEDWELMFLFLKKWAG